MSKIIIGHLSLHTDGIAYYGKKGSRVIFKWPINLGYHVIHEVGDEPIRLEIDRESKQIFVIGYDSKLGMIMKSNLQRATVVPMIIESICRKFKVSSILSKMQTITKNGVTTIRRVWIDSPDSVEEDKIRKFLSKTC